MAITQYTDLEIERDGLLTYDREYEEVYVDSGTSAKA